MTENGTPLSYGRWDEYRKATDKRLDELERFAHERVGMAENLRALTDRVAALEHRDETHEESARHRRDRTWLIGLTILSGFVLPLIVTTVITLLHLRNG